MRKLSEAVLWTHMTVTAGGFGVVLEEMGAEVAPLFAALAAMAAVPATLLYTAHMWEKYREEQE